MILSYADACLAMPSHSKKHPHVRNGNKFVDEDSELLRRRSLSLAVAFCGTPSQITRYKQYYDDYELCRRMVNHAVAFRRNGVA